MMRYSAIAFALLMMVGTVGCKAAAMAMSDGKEIEQVSAMITYNEVSAVDYTNWPLWNAYLDKFVERDGRVVDHTGGGHSTSEGQSYALFFALVANDQQMFETLLEWTKNNLSKGDLAANLPAWKWGERKDGTWGVIDSNSASDADLWIAYSLLEAAKLWNKPEYDRLGRAVLKNVVDQETADMPGLGPMLLPGPEGFQIGESAWRINPSYLPVQQLQAFVTHDAPGPWKEIHKNTLRMIREVTPKGFIADWVVYSSATGGFAKDPVSGAIGSYDAIRNYLWAGMLHDDSPYKAQVAGNLSGMYKFWKSVGNVPVRVSSWNGLPLGSTAPVGFLACLLPEVQAMPNSDDFEKLKEQINLFKNKNLYGVPPAYYDQNLILFAQGFIEYRFRFNPDGTLQPGWKS